MSTEKEQVPHAAPAQEKKRRNWALFGALMFFVAIIYAVTIVKIKTGLGG